MAVQILNLEDKIVSEILIIEDNDEINGLLKELLINAGYDVKQAFSGPEGLLYFSNGTYALILLDLMLPGMAGESVLAKIRETSEVPIIIISAKTDMDGKVLLLQTGADDYITKPFDMREVLARVELQLKRKGTTAKGQIVYQELHLDSENHLITIDGTPLSFTRQEFAIMELLMKHPDKIYSKQELYELAWEECYIGEDKTLNVHISNIRKKIKLYSEREYIETVWGIGFRLKK